MALKAHGGLDRWKKVKAIKVAASITGAIWFVKGKGDYLRDVVLTVETQKERVTVDFPVQNRRAIFEPNRIVIETADGSLIEALDNPEESFAGQQRETPWNDIHVVYFVGEALWTYLNTPFLYTYEGFTTEEVAPIQVEGETWRRLKAGMLFITEHQNCRLGSSNHSAIWGLRRSSGSRLRQTWYLCRGRNGSRWVATATILPLRGQSFTS